jgi:putative transposase
VTEANASERNGSVIVLDEAIEQLSKLEVVWVGRGYSGDNFAQPVRQVCGRRTYLHKTRNPPPTGEPVA